MNAHFPTILGAVTGVVCLVILWLLWPQKPFMTVYEMTVVQDRVRVDRQISGDMAVPADWLVTVVSKTQDAPSCQTVTGPELHQGWSVYKPSERAVTAFSLDEWVGDPGCYKGLIAGAYHMFVTWTPRNDRLPVSAHTTFKIE